MTAPELSVCELEPAITAEERDRALNLWSDWCMDGRSFVAIAVRYLRAAESAARAEAFEEAAQVAELPRLGWPSRVALEIADAIRARGREKP